MRYGVAAPSLIPDSHWLLAWPGGDEIAYQQEVANERWDVSFGKRALDHGSCEHGVGGTAYVRRSLR